MRFSLRRCFAATFLVAQLVPGTIAYVMMPPMSEEDEARNIIIAKKLFDPSSSSSSLAVNPPPQPRCWFNALKVFQPKDKEDVETLNKMCAKMGPQEQQAFAFEIARCHLAEMGRAIIETFVSSDIEDAQDCTALAVAAARTGLGEDDPEDDEGWFPNLKQCLVNLTQDGVTAYTYFFTQVVQLCNRLTEHLVADLREHTSAQLAKFSQQAVDQFNNLVKRQQDAFEEREEAIRQRHEEFYSSMNSMQQEIMEGQSNRVDEFKAWTSAIMDDWGTRAQRQKEQQEAWLHNQTKFLENKASEWEQQRWFPVTGFLAPSMNMEKLSKAAIDIYRFFVLHGYNLFEFSFHFIGVLYVAYLMTLPRSCRKFRGAIFVIIFTEGLAELCFTFCTESGQISGTYQKAVVACLRNAAFCFEALLYSVGLISSCCCCWKSDTGHDDDDGHEDSSESDRHLQQEMERRQQVTQTEVNTAAPPTHERHRELIQFEVRRLMQEVMSTQTQPISLTTNMPSFHNHSMPPPSQKYAAIPPSQTSVLPSPPPMMQHHGTLGQREVHQENPNNILGMVVTPARDETINNGGGKHQSLATGQQLFAPAGTSTSTGSLQQVLVAAPGKSSPKNKKRTVENLSQTTHQSMAADSTHTSSPKRRRIMPAETEAMETSNEATKMDTFEAAAAALMDNTKDDTMEEWEDKQSEGEHDEDDQASMEEDDDDGTHEEDELEQQHADMDTQEQE